MGPITAGIRELSQWSYARSEFGRGCLSGDWDNKFMMLGSLRTTVSQSCLGHYTLVLFSPQNKHFLIVHKTKYM